MRLVMLVVAGVASATHQQRVTGRVVDATGRPLAGAEVRVAAREDLARTDDSGRFVLPGVAIPARLRMMASPVFVV